MVQLEQLGRQALLGCRVSLDQVVCQAGLELLDLLELQVLLELLDYLATPDL
jgi:hypothetical protein